VTSATAPWTTPSTPLAADGDRRDVDRLSRPPRPWWGRWTQLLVAAVAGALYVSNLSVNGLGNPYYAAAVKSGSVSWKAFFFGSVDPGSFITVDKPPAAFWLPDLSARLFGYSSWSILLPDAVAGIVAATVTYHLARRMLAAAARGHGAGMLGSLGPKGAEMGGLLAGLALAVTPIGAVMFRFNDPDALLTLFLILASWAGWVAIERGSIRHLVLAGFIVGLAFLCKELVAAVVVPGLALAWIVAAPLSLRRRLWGWLWSGLMLVLSAGWWVAVVQLLPASDRPYIASSSNNSIVSVIFGYNGFSRLFGSHRGGGATHAAATHAVTGRATEAVGQAFGGGRGFGGGGGGFGGFGGGAGWTRMFASTLGSQISWLLPLAAVGLVFGLLSAGRSPRSDLRRAGYILWGGWAAAAFVVFSKSSGTFHGYYVVALAPPVALLAAVGAVDLWAVGRSHRSLCWLLPFSIAGSGAWAWALLDRDPSYHPWLRTAILVAAIVGAVGMLITSVAAPRLLGTSGDPASGASGNPANPGTVPSGGGRRLLRPLGVAAAAVAAVALLAGPTAWAASSSTSARNGTNPTAGPSSAATTGFSFGGAGRAGRGTVGGSGGFGGANGFGGAAGFGDANGFGDAAGFGDASGTTERAGGAGRTGGAGGFGGGATSGPSAGDQSFVKWLEANRNGAKYLVAVDGSMSADDLIIASGKPVLDLGGFSGNDPYPTLAQFEHLVTQGKVRYVLVSSGGGFGGRGGNSAVSTVLSWVEAHGTEVPTSRWGGSVSGTLYEVTPATGNATS
jgi:4-amino-4-deoxy-L-arabinose transferase-like glycosyltransferase